MSGAIKGAKMGVTVPTPNLAQGDPGLFGGIVGAFKGGAGAFIRGGNPFVGAARGAARGFRGRPSVSAPSDLLRERQLAPLPLPATFRPPTPGVGMTGPVRTMAAPVAPTAVGATGTAVAVVQPKGFHLNKSDYFLKSGAFIAKGTRWIKNRRRNPLNPRALRRAISRIDAGKIWQGKLHEISTAKFTAAGNRKD